MEPASTPRTLFDKRWQSHADVALTLQQVEFIRDYERNRHAHEPWLFT